MPLPVTSDAAGLRDLVARLVDAREEERLRVARTLHDELGQLLTALRLELGALALVAGGPVQAQRLVASADLVGASMSALRRISEGLRPLVLDDLGLHAALEWLTEQSSRRLGIEVTLRRDADEPPADPRVATATYRAVQEALDNVERHARATDVAVTLHRQGESLELSVEDNGLGLPAGALEQPSTWRLRTLEEHIKVLGGSLWLENVRGGGTRLRLAVPLRPAQGPVEPAGPSPTPAP